jgi:predicted metal-dependent HD superfamily phosphohydrolase
VVDVRESWNHLWQRLPARVVPAEVFDELVALYSAPERFYHNLSHIADCLQVFELAKSYSIHPDEVRVAIWFHDAIYDTKGSGNEQKSAEWASSVIKQAGVSKDVARRVSQMILVTCHSKEVAGVDERVMADVDLSILGKEGGIFWEYEDNIRREYAWVPERVFKQKRTEILRGFLNREYIYHLDVYRNKFEDTARENIKKALSRLLEI